MRCRPAVSPLALAQGQRDIQNLVQYHQITSAIMGPQAGSAQYDEGELMEYIRTKLNVDDRLFADETDMQQKLAMIMGAQSMGVDPTTGAAPMQGA